MAKTGINIGADTTIVGAAGNLARSMQPRDTTKSMDGVLKARGEMLNNIEKNFKKTTELIDGGNAELKETIGLIQQKLNNGDLTSTEREELQVKMEDYRARMKEIPFGRKGREQRDGLMYEINREIKTAKNRDAAMADVLTSLDNDQYDPSQLDPNYINFLNQIGKNAAEEETDPGFIKTKNDKGETVYSYTYTDEAGEEQKIEGTVYDIQKKINGTKKDFEYIKNQNEVIFGWEKWAKDHPNANFDEVYNRISSSMETSFAQSPDKFKSIINHPMGWNKKSYVETLRDPQSPEFQSVIQALEEIGADEFDFDGSGTVDAADFVSEENVNTMIKALTDPSATQRRTAHRAAATFYADTEARKAFDFGKRDRPKTGGGGGGKGDKTDNKYTTENYMVNNQQVKFTAQYKKDTRKAIANREEVSGKFGLYKWTEGADDTLGYYTDANGEQLTPFQVANREYSTGGDGSSHADFATAADTGSGKPAAITGGVTWDLINEGNDDDAAANLNTHFDNTDFSKRYKFVPQYGWADITGISEPDNPVSDDIMILDVTTGKPARDSEGNSYRFGTGLFGEGDDEGAAIIDQINSTDILAPYIDQKKRALIDENEAYGNVNP